MCHCCSSNLSSLSFTGPQGISIASITSTAVVGGSNLTITLSNGGTQGPFFIASGTNGTNGASIISVAWTSNSAGSPQGTLGTIDTYTCYTGAGNTNPVGTFTVTNAAVATPVTMANVGNGKEVYQTGTYPNAQFKTISSSNASVIVGYNGLNEIDLTLPVYTWLTIMPSGFISPTQPVFVSSPGGGFTTIANESSFGTCAMKYDPYSGRVYFKGAFSMTGTNLTQNPTGLPTNTLIQICTLPTSLIPTNSAQTVTSTCQITSINGPGTPISSTAEVLINSTGVWLRISNRLNQIMSGQVISLENCSYTL
jgi:hypothetical protein